MLHGEGAQARASCVRAWALGTALGDIMRASGQAPARDAAGARNDVVVLMKLTMSRLQQSRLQQLHEVLNPEPPQPHEQLDLSAMTGLREALAPLCPYGHAIQTAKNTSALAMRKFDEIDASQQSAVHKRKEYDKVCLSLYTLMTEQYDRQPGAVDEPELLFHINAAITRAEQGPAA